MARPAQFNPDDILRQATDVFWRKGYHRTSVRDLLAVTGYNRRGLYDHFGGKEGLFAAALDFYRIHYIEKILSLLSASGAGLDGLRELFRLRLSADPKRGCLILNTIADEAGVEQRHYDFAKAQNDRIEAGVHRCILGAQRVGEIPAHKDSLSLARQIMVVLHSIRPVSRAGMSLDQLEDIGIQTIESLQS
jgi:TetR/AcrR family transcriptional repressor of nem operon